MKIYLAAAHTDKLIKSVLGVEEPHDCYLFTYFYFTDNKDIPQPIKDIKGRLKNEKRQEDKKVPQSMGLPTVNDNPYVREEDEKRGGP